MINMPSLFLPSRPFAPRQLGLGLLLVCAVLVGCGGGKGGDSSSGGGGVTEFASGPTLSGIAAVGAPLMNARVAVVDGSGASLGSTTTRAPDGSYSLTLSSKSLTAPLLVQVSGLDTAGNPQVLHSAVPILAANASAMVAHVSPLSNAVVALALGADPQPVFAAAKSNGPALAAAATAASAAGEFVKTLVKTQLTDLKFSNPTALSLLADPAFAANKGAHDLLIESLRVSLVKNSKGVMQLQLSNKLQPSQAAEVVVDLPMAQTELLKTSSPTPTSAITSTLKATTSPTATLANLAALDDLSAALNKLIAQGASAATIGSHALLAGYDTHNGRLKAALATKLADYVAKNRQFGRWQITGCADDTVTGGLCKRVLVAAPISDVSGTVVDTFSDAVSYSKTSTTGSVWNLIGNGKKLALAVYPLAFRALAADGTNSTAITPNPVAGLQISIQTLLEGSDAPLLTQATVQTPGGFSIPFANCGQAQLCISSTAGATSLVPTGGLADTALLRSSVGWIGADDLVLNAKYLVTYSLSGTAESRTVYLPADVPAELPAARFPTLDGISSSAPLRSSQLPAGLTINWSAWAAANPDLRLISVRTVLNVPADPTQAPLINDTTPPLPPSTTLALAGISVPDAFVASNYELWLGAQDVAGRRYYTRYTLAP
ncbi:hypothetical protein [Roseateles sp. PN1]|uniref:hypothetical protein n=1 Tax=Roseateles sp. PN1 TaxID=3137372 RepID=UPI003139C00B